MKITKRQLRSIIREAVKNNLTEMRSVPSLFSATEALANALDDYTVAVLQDRGVFSGEMLDQEDLASTTAFVESFIMEQVAGHLEELEGFIEEEYLKRQAGS